MTAVDRTTVGRDAGQASVELVAFLPLVLLIALVVFSFAAAQAAREEAGAAAEAADIAFAGLFDQPANQPCETDDGKPSAAHKAI